MMLKVILYVYMNNIYSCRKIEQLLLRDIHYIRLAGSERPDFITINRFRNRVKEEINNVFTQQVLILADKGFIGLDVAYIDGTKKESKANKRSCHETKPGYNLQIGTENPFITDFAFFPNPFDALTLIPFFSSFSDRYNMPPSIGVADSVYGAEENYLFMQDTYSGAYPFRNPEA